MRINVLALGESVATYRPDGNTTVGVNDIFKFFPVDHLVVIDRPTRFHPDRVNTIVNSKPTRFYSHLPEWSTLPNFKHIDLSAGVDFRALDVPGIITHSNNSAFVAAVLAYKLGGKEIVIYGADFKTHPNFHPNTIRTALQHFSTLYKELKRRGVRLYVSSPQSRLAEFLPIR